MNDHLDDRDQKLLKQCVMLLDREVGPRVGDFVHFSDGTERRISYLWEHGAQTSVGGSYYLAFGYCSFSGSLHRSVPSESLRATADTKLGDCWFFHHDDHCAHNGVDVQVPFRVYQCDLPPPG